MKNLVVVFSADDNYSMHLGVSIVSLLENNIEFNEILIYVIERNITEENKKNLINLVKRYNRKLVFINFNDIESKIKSKIDNSKSISIYARLFIATILPNDVEKAIYFDCDSIINNSLLELWNTDIEKFYLAGVEDTVSLKYKLAIKMNYEDRYINSGMLLINLKKWRSDNLENKFLKFINSYNGNVPHHDQGTINGVCKGKILYLDPKYNVNTNIYLFTAEEIESAYNLKKYYTENELENARENPVFIHYTPGFAKRPWILKSRHPKKSLYFKYKDLTPWKNYKLKNDDSNWKIKTLSTLYYIFPRRVFMKIYKSII